MVKKIIAIILTVIYSVAQMIYSYVFGAVLALAVGFNKEAPVIYEILVYAFFVIGFLTVAILITAVVLHLLKNKLALIFYGITWAFQIITCVIIYVIINNFNVNPILICASLVVTVIITFLLLKQRKTKVE